MSMPESSVVDKSYIWESPKNFTYMGRTFSGLSGGDDSSAFNDCNNDKLGEFPTTASQNRQLLIACATDNSDDLIRQLLQEYGVTTILNPSLCDENKELIASSGVIKPLVRALRIRTPTAKENDVCALLRLSQVEENKKDVSTALYSLCSVKENKLRVGWRRWGGEKEKKKDKSIRVILSFYCKKRD
ncbi:hypothetical protein UlMin_022652 [Ulmus minor]